MTDPILCIMYVIDLDKNSIINPKHRNDLTHYQYLQNNNLQHANKLKLA